LYHVKDAGFGEHIVFQKVIFALFGAVVKNFFGVPYNFFDYIYHLWASLKDLGKKWFAFSKMGMGGIELIGKIKGVT